MQVLTSTANHIGSSPVSQAQSQPHEQALTGFTVRDDEAATGYGLGRYICRQIVEAHGGKIGLDSPSKRRRRVLVYLACVTEVTWLASEA